MNNQEQHLANPEDEEAVRREMGEKCIGKFAMSDVSAFFADSVDPALNTFALLSDPETIDKDRFEIDMRGKPYYHEGVLDGLPYSGFSYGFRVTTTNWLFYYYVYAMSPPFTPFGLTVCLSNQTGSLEPLMTLSHARKTRCLKM